MLWMALLLGVGFVAAKVASIERSPSWPWGVAAAGATWLLGLCLGTWVLAAPILVLVGEIAVLGWLRSVETQRRVVGDRVMPRARRAPGWFGTRGQV